MFLHDAVCVFSRVFHPTTNAQQNGLCLFYWNISLVYEIAASKCSLNQLTLEIMNL